MVESVAIVDFGGQYTHLLYRRLRELGFRAIIVPYKSLAEFQIEEEGVRAVILSGGAGSVDDNPTYLDAVKRVLSRCGEGLPVLGIALGHLLIAYALGCPISKNDRSEHGETRITLVASDVIFDGIQRELTVWMSHTDSLITPTCGIQVLAVSENGVIAAYRHREMPVYGFQFNPEAEHTERGTDLLLNFVSRVAGMKPSWKPEEAIDKVIERLSKTYPEGNALVAVSGGVDSITTALIFLRAFGPDRVHAVFIDTGLMREGDAQRVRLTLENMGLRHIHLIDASSMFLSQLRSVVDPEEKRLVISRTFKEVFSQVIKELEEIYGKFAIFGQGTIYPDRIESGMTGSDSGKIKSHHNVVMGPLDNVAMIEPLADFYKDEVRAIARHLGVPEYIIRRHPYPGPGLAIRIVGEVDEEKLRIVRKATQIVEDVLEEEGLYDRLWQAFPVLLPVRAVGIRGGKRAYGYVIALRFVESSDAMTARFSRMPWEVLAKISARLINEIPQVTRVVYDITNKPPGTIEYE